MLEFPCRHCGHVQFLHENGYVDEGWCADGIVPTGAYPVSLDQYYKEQVDEERAEARARHIRGYQYNLRTCPGFTHRVRDFGFPLIKRAFEEGIPSHFLPSELEERAEELHGQWEEERRRADAQLNLHLGVHVYIVPRMGGRAGSQVYIGE